MYIYLLFLNAVNILIIVILQYLSDNSNTLLHYLSGCDACLISSDYLFFSLPFNVPSKFLFKVILTYQVIGADLNRHFVCGFTLTFLRIGLYLMFVVAAGAETSISSPLKSLYISVLSALIHCLLELCCYSDKTSWRGATV